MQATDGLVFLHNLGCDFKYYNPNKAQMPIVFTYSINSCHSNILTLVKILSVSGIRIFITIKFPNISSSQWSIAVCRVPLQTCISRKAATSYSCLCLRFTSAKSENTLSISFLMSSKFYRSCLGDSYIWQQICCVNPIKVSL